MTTELVHDDAAARAPLREVSPVDERCTFDRRADGSWIIERVEPLEPYPLRLTERLLQWAAERPNEVFLAQRPSGRLDAVGEWDARTYAQCLEAVRAIGQAILERQLGPQRPVMILSDNDIDNQLLALACTHIGVPYVPVTPAYSLLSKDHARLRWLAERVRPGLVFASDGDLYQKAFAAAFDGVECVCTRPGDTRATPFAQLLAAKPTAAVDRAFESVGADHVVKVLFTSGTTGEPKGVVFTQRMVCSNRQQSVQALPFLLQGRFVTVDWLPWHHTFGGTQNVGNALYNGGSYYIDPGKPTAQDIGLTVQALREVAPTYYAFTPTGLAALLPFLRDDAALRTRFFSRLLAVQVGGAVFPQHVWQAFDEVSVAHCGQRLLFVAGLGSTECGPLAAITCRDPQRRMLVGLPTAGTTVKLVPNEAGLEIRFKGPSVSPAYWGDAELTQSSRDDEGFFCIGDAVHFIDPSEPALGLAFGGRVSENFKVATGTWVVVAPLRLMALDAFAPYAHDVVIAGEGQTEVGALVFPAIDRCRELDPTLRHDASAGEVLASPLVRDVFAQRLAVLHAQGTGSAGRIARIRLEADPPTLDSGELTAKSAISARTVLRCRAAAVADLYSPHPSEHVVANARTPH